MQRPVKYLEKGLTTIAKSGWKVARKLDARSNPNPAFTPNWSEKPMLKSWEKTKPPLGWPRQTDSLCPKCVREAREVILSGEVDYSILKTDKVGEVKATILQRGNEIWMVKDCPRHGRTGGLDGDRRQVPRAHRGPVSGTRHPCAQRRGSAQPRILDGQVGPRRGPDGGPDEPLQHDVRPVLHGRQPGRFRPTSSSGKRSRPFSTTPSGSSPAGRCRCSSRAASRRCRRTS